MQWASIIAICIICVAVVVAAAVMIWLFTIGIASVSSVCAIIAVTCTNITTSPFAATAHYLIGCCRSRRRHHCSCRFRRR